MYEILLDNRNGNVWDISSLVSGFTWKTSRIGRSGSLDFTLIKNGLFQNSSFQYSNGDIVSFRKNNQNIFQGYIFSIDEGKDESVKILCYDQIRYLLFSDTYVLTNVTASDIIRMIAKDFKLHLGQIEETVYRIPTMVEDGSKLLDIIDKALTLTLIHTNQNFILFDDFGLLTLRNAEKMLIEFIIGDSSLMHNYSMKSSIDNDTYNRVKLYRDNKASGKRELYIAQDSDNIAKWGTLQMYQSVDENMNQAQISQRLDMLMKLKNREAKSLKIDAIGDLRVRAGCYVRIFIEEQGINQPFLVDECTHNFDGADHTMSLDLKVI